MKFIEHNFLLWYLQDHSRSGVIRGCSVEPAGRWPKVIFWRTWRSYRQSRSLFSTILFLYRTWNGDTNFNNLGGFDFNGLFTNQNIGTWYALLAALLFGERGFTFSSALTSILFSNISSSLSFFFSPSSLLFHLQYLSCLPSLSWLVEVALVHSLATAGSKFFWQDMIRWWNLYDVKWHSGDILKPPLSDLFSTVWHKGLATSRGVLTTGEINFNCCPAILEFGLFFWNMSNISW